MVALLAFDDVDAALDAVGGLRRALDCLQAVELFFQDGLDLVCDRLGLARPFAARHRAFVLVEAAAGTDPTVALAAAIEGLAGLADVAVADDDRAARALWRYREAHTEAINLLGSPHKLDVTLPADQLSGFVAEVRDQVKSVAADAVVWLFGHAADGNIHVNVTGVEPDDDRVTDAVLRLVARRHGSISATSEALYVHPNTLRQRLRRIAELSGLDLRRDDWLAIEIAVKMVKLEQALGAAKPHT